MVIKPQKSARAGLRSLREYRQLWCEERGGSGRLDTVQYIGKVFRYA